MSVEAPVDRIMLETDCPYLSPEPKRKVRPNEPAFLVHTAEMMAQVRNMKLEEMAHIATENSLVFFGVDDVGGDG